MVNNNLYNKDSETIDSYNNLLTINQKKDSIQYYFRIMLAEKRIEVECIYLQVFQFCKQYLAEFEKPDFIIRITNEDIKNETKRSNLILFDHNDLEVRLDEYTEINALLRKITRKFLEYNILLMHGAAISVNNKCYLFIAPSGVGKTTHIKNWINCIPGTIVVNGDKPFIDVDKCIVYGSPWCGKEGMNTNIGVPLGGIIALERGMANEIVPIKFGEMLPYLLKQTYFPDNKSKAVVSLISQLKEIPFYHLRCNMDQESALIAYKTIIECIK